MAISFDDIPGVEWVPGTGEFIAVNPESCIGCANCVKVCLGGCYKIIEKKR